MLLLCTCRSIRPLPGLRWCRLPPLQNKMVHQIFYGADSHCIFLDHQPNNSSYLSLNKYFSNYFITTMRSIIKIGKREYKWGVDFKNSNSYLTSTIVQLSDTSLTTKGKQLQKHCHIVMWALLSPLLKPNGLRAPSFAMSSRHQNII